MKQEEFDKMLEECFSRMKQILICKGADYSGKDDRFGNFRLSEKMGIPVWKGILIRISDKVSRVLNLASGSEAKVKDESLEDTLLDLANYSLLCLIAYREAKFPNGIPGIAMEVGLQKREAAEKLKAMAEEKLLFRREHGVPFINISDK